MNITKQKQTHRCTEQTSDSQWGEGMGEEQPRGRGLGGTNYHVQSYEDILYRTGSVVYIL